MSAAARASALDSLSADKAYGSKANRAALRAHKIKAMIPEKVDVIAGRQRRGS